MDLIHRAFFIDFNLLNHFRRSSILLLCKASRLGGASTNIKT